MIWVITAVFVVLAVLAFMRRRWAYWAFVAGGILFFRRASIPLPSEALRMRANPLPGALFPHELRAPRAFHHLLFNDKRPDAWRSPSHSTSAGHRRSDGHGNLC